MTRWTKKHQELCLENNLPPAAIHLWQWLLRQAKPRELFTPDFKDFNAWIARKRGKPYCRLTIKNAIVRLAEVGIVAIGRTYTWHERDLMLCGWGEENLQEENSSNPPPNEDSASEAQQKKTAFLQQQQEIKDKQSALSEELKNHGIEANPSMLRRLTFWSVERIKDALRLFYVRGGQKKVFNPIGFIHDCLKFNWLKDFDRASWLHQIQIIWERLDPDSQEDSAWIEGVVSLS